MLIYDVGYIYIYMRESSIREVLLKYGKDTGLDVKKTRL